MPSVAVAGVRRGESAAGNGALGIDMASVQDAAGKLYDVYAADSEAGRKALAARVKAARTLETAREPHGLGFALDRVIAFEPGEEKGPTRGTAVMMTVHQDGQTRPLDLLTLDDCAAMGTAIGAIHRLGTKFLTDAGYPAFTTGQIRAQLVAWIKRLRQAGHVPSEITSSWTRIVETEGLWSFATCLVHGGFEDGDVRFAGSTITAINNWNDMQINDPARDLGWVFSKLDEAHRNAVITAYGRMMGNRLDEMIMLRANLWVQMEQVGDFIKALSRADPTGILQFKAQVDRLAHQLGVTTPAARTGAGTPAARSTGEGSPSTITVGTLLAEGRRQSASPAAAKAGVRTVGTVETADPNDDTNESPSDDTMDSDRTSSSQIVAATGHPTSATIAITRMGGNTGEAASWDDATADRQPVATTRETDTDEADDTADNTAEREPATIAIPLLEREERALRDAQEGLDLPSKGVAKTSAN